MIDIHCHLLFGVDDGADSLEESVAMLKDAKEQGIDAILLTPHYRHGMFPYDKERILRHAEELKPYAKELGIRMELGTEYHVNSRIVDAMRSGRCLTLAGTHYVLTEYEFETEWTYIKKMTQELIFQGFVPIVAHVERYGAMVADLDRAEELQRMGALIQINCDAVLGLGGRAEKKYTKKLLKEGFVDVIASDMHGIKERACHMKKCYQYVAKKFGVDEAERLMHRNPYKIFADADMQRKE